MSHTPGPWITAGPDGTGIAPASMPGERLAVAMAMNCELTEDDMYGDDMPLESQVANARLIAAAPELLAALKMWMALETTSDGMRPCYCEDSEMVKPCPHCVAFDAIAKAEGRSER